MKRKSEKPGRYKEGRYLDVLPWFTRRALPRAIGWLWQLLREFLLVAITRRAIIQVFLEEPGAFSLSKTSLQTISLSASRHLTERGTQKFLQCLTSGRVSYGWVKRHLSSLPATDHYMNIHTSSPHYQFETLLGSKLETGPCTTRRRTMGEWSWAPLVALMLL